MILILIRMIWAYQVILKKNIIRSNYPERGGGMHPISGQTLARGRPNHRIAAKRFPTYSHRMKQ